MSFSERFGGNSDPLERLFKKINRKLDAILALQGITIEQLKELESGEEVAIHEMIARLKTSGDALKAATDANQSSSK